MTKRRILQLLAVARAPFDCLGIGGGMCVLVLVFAVVVLLAGCAATHANQDLSLPGPGAVDTPPRSAAPSPPAAPSREEFNALQSAQTGLVNLVTNVSQRAEANATAVATLSAQGFGTYTSQFGVGAVVCVGLALVLAGIGLGYALRRVSNIAERMCATVDRITDGLVKLLNLDEVGDQKREAGK